MCLVALAIDQSQRFPLVVAANRDEYFKRPTARLAWWSPGAGQPDILGGRDLEAGGTWMGLTAAGRFALVTNIREPSRNDPDAPSRGAIVPLWLRGDLTADRFWPRVALSGYNGVNLIAADFRDGACFHASTRELYPQRLERGLYGLSNAGLDTPWPKVMLLKARLGSALHEADSVEDLGNLVFDALADREIPPDTELPATGVPIDRERQLAPAFIRMPDLSYGTRSSIVVITERARRHRLTHVVERSFAPGTGLALVRHSVLKDWPPRYLDGTSQGISVQETVSESTLPVDPEGPASVRKRVRSLLRPEAVRRR